MLKTLFTFVTDQYSLFDNYLYNWFVLFIIGLISYKIAFRFIGQLYRENFISGSSIGKILHWAVRFIIFTALVVIVSFVIWIIRLIIALPVYIWIILCVAVILSVSIYASIKILRRPLKY